MKLILYFFIFLLSLTSLFCFAQTEQAPVKVYETEKGTPHLGLGLGLDYGGLGLRLTYEPVKYLGIFAGAGFNLYKAGYNVGALFKLLPGRRVTPFLAGMYGYNAVVVIKGASEFNKIFYGPSVGLGCEIWNRRLRNYLGIALLIPIRSKEFYDYEEALANNYRIKDFQRALPFAVSVGYHFGIW